jgi:ubiquinone/menaquinone biosynthesis C-methylase UbiE
VTDRFVDRGYLTGVQYASDANLASRQAIYRFQTPPVRTAAWALDLAGLRGDERVLDIGCGNGLHLAELARRAHRGPVFGLDLSPGMLTAAQSHSRAPLVVGDAEQLPFAAESLDRVLAMHMLYHVPNRDRAIAEIRRVLRAGGTALFLTNSRRHLAELNDMVASALFDVGAAETRTGRAYLDFSSESGDGELRRHFASVEKHDVRSELVVTEARAIVEYVATMSWIAGPANGTAVLREVERRSRGVIEAEGAVRIRTDVGCFVCR